MSFECSEKFRAVALRHTGGRPRCVCFLLFFPWLPTVLNIWFRTLILYFDRSRRIISKVPLKCLDSYTIFNQCDLFLQLNTFKLTSSAHRCWPNPLLLSLLATVTQVIRCYGRNHLCLLTALGRLRWWISYVVIFIFTFIYSNGLWPFFVSLSLIYRTPLRWLYLLYGLWPFISSLSLYTISHVTILS